MRHVIGPRVIELSHVSDVKNFTYRIFPYDGCADPRISKASHELFMAYVLLQIDSLHYSHPMECPAIEFLFLNIQDFSKVSKNIENILKDAYEIQFLSPKDLKTGMLYLWCEEKTDSIHYAVMKGAKCFRGEIVDKEYDHFKRRLKNKGALSLREVNFLMEKTIRQNSHLKKREEVIDSLCRHYFSQFLTYDASLQDKAVQLLLIQLEPYRNFDFFNVGSWHGFHEMPYSLKNQEKREERELEDNHLKYYGGSEKLMTADAICWRNADQYQDQLEMDEFEQ